jgi:putative oxidoreductase
LQSSLASFIAHGVYVGEVIAPALLIADWYSRAAGASIPVDMVFAISLVHVHGVRQTEQQRRMGPHVLFMAVSLALLGSGGFSINRQ